MGEVGFVLRGLTSAFRRRLPRRDGSWPWSCSHGLRGRPMNRSRGGTESRKEAAAHTPHEGQGGRWTRVGQRRRQCRRQKLTHLCAACKSRLRWGRRVTRGKGPEDMPSRCPPGGGWASDQQLTERTPGQGERNIPGPPKGLTPSRPRQSHTSNDKASKHTKEN